jgi:hypothetical protein
MVSRTPTLIKRDKVVTYIRNMYKVEVTQNDTITLGEFDSSKNLKQAWLVKDSDGSEITCTFALNIVTVTGTATNETCTLFAFGEEA